MRNLKRALSLAMASVMTLGMMTVGANAKGLADFSDAAEIINADAVAVTSAIGIFKGYEDGQFKGKNIVTRAEMAVICAKMLYGADLDPSQFVGVKTFSDTPAWAEGYINLCASLGIIAGRGNGIFDPNATVTTAEASMMLSKTLGYFKSQKDFGNDWILASTAKATQLGLYGDLKLAAQDGLTRDNVAELVFNALTQAVPVQYNELLGVYYNENQGIVYSLEYNYLETLGYKNFDLVYRTGDVSAYGRPGTTWGIGSYKSEKVNSDGSLITGNVKMLSSDEIITLAAQADFSYSEGTKAKDVYKDLGSTVYDFDWVAYVDGELTEKAVKPGKNDSKDYKYTADGATTEFFVDKENEQVTVVEVNHYLAEVTRVREDDDGRYITLKVPTYSGTLDDNTFYTEKFNEDDYVLVTIDVDEDGDSYIASVDTPETIDGVVSIVHKESDGGSTGTYLKIDGVKYRYSMNTSGDLKGSTDTHPTLDKEYRLYMDPNGFVIGFQALESLTENYLYVKAISDYDGLDDYRAKVVFADGTTKTIDVDDTAFKADKKTEVSPSTCKGYVCSYSVNSKDIYTLTQVEKSSGIATESLRNGYAYMDGKFFDEDTVFVDVVDGVIYTGFNAVPSFEKAEVVCVNANPSDKTEDVVFIINYDSKFDGTSAYVILADTDFYTLRKDDVKYAVYPEAYIDGVKVEDGLFVEYDQHTKITGKGLYEIEKFNDDEFVKQIKAAGAMISGEAVARGKGSFWIDDTRFSVVDDETVFVVVDRTKSTYKVSTASDEYCISVNDPVSERRDGDKYVWVEVVDYSKKGNENVAKMVYVYTDTWVNTYDLILDKGAGTTLTADKANFAKGDEVVITAGLEADYTDLVVKVNGEAVTLTDGKYTFTAPGKDVTVKAEATPIAKSSITVNGGNAYIIANDTEMIPMQKFNVGSEVKLSIVPYIGYELKSVKIDGVDASIFNGMVFKNITVAEAGHTIDVVAEQIQMP